MSSQGPMDVIYILSNGRSGSTLLDLLLGAHPRLWTLARRTCCPGRCAVV